MPARGSLTAPSSSKRLSPFGSVQSLPPVFTDIPPTRPRLSRRVGELCRQSPPSLSLSSSTLPGAGAEAACWVTATRHYPAGHPARLARHGVGACHPRSSWPCLCPTPALSKSFDG